MNLDMEFQKGDQRQIYRSDACGNCSTKENSNGLQYFLFSV